MAATKDQDLGTFTQASTTTTIPLTTAATAASGTKVVVGLGWFNAVTVTGVADDSGLGYTWRVTVQGNNSNNCYAIAEADCPSGLPSGTVITATLSGAGGQARQIGATSFLTVKTGAALNSDSRSQSSVTAWTASAAGKPATAGDLIFGGSKEGSGADNTDTPTSPYVELYDFGATNGNAVTSMWDATTGGTVTVGGTWSGSSTVMSCQAVMESSFVPQQFRPDADNDAATWTTTPLWSKIEEVSADGTVITATAS